MNNINLLITYLTDDYINNNNIPQWNVHDLNDHRTNNDMEGYHHRLRERFTNRIVNYWGFMLFILKVINLVSYHVNKIFIMICI